MKHQGFTLLEVMISLIVIALSMVTVIYTMVENSRQMHYLQQKVNAHAIAWNIVNEYRAQIRKKLKDQGKVTFLHQTVVWFSNIQVIPKKSALKLNVIVQEINHKEVIAEVTTWLPLYRRQ